MTNLKSFYPKLIIVDFCKKGTTEVYKTSTIVNNSRIHGPFQNSQNATSYKLGVSYHSMYHSAGV